VPFESDGDDTLHEIAMSATTRVLISIEDESAMDLLAEPLLEAGYIVDRAGSSIEAGTLLEKRNTDILIIDLYLCDENPFNIVKVAKKMNPFMEFIALCYMDDFAKVQEVHAKGFTGIIPKPVTSDNKLIEVVACSARRIRQVKEREGIIKEGEDAMAIAKILADSSTKFNHKLEQCLTIILSYLGAERGSILLVDRPSNENVMVASTQDKLIGMRNSLDEESVASWVVKHKQPLNINDVDEAEELNFRKVGHYEGEAFLAYPIMYDEKVVGVFNVTEKESGAFTKNDETALLRFLGRIAAVIENATLHEKVTEEREKLSIAYSDLKKLEEIRNNLVSMLVHDLKSPIGEIMGNLSMLEGVQLKDYQKETLLLAMTGTENLLSMVTDILDVSKMEEGKLTLHLGETDLIKILQEKANHLEALLKLDEKKISLEADGDFTLQADNAIIARVVANLVTNAVNYSPDGGEIKITVEDIDGGKVRVGVMDEGPGVPEEFKDKIFMKFGQVDSDKNRHKHSTGLGLTFCKMAIDAHGGEIWVENRDEGGSAFFFTLPR